jgi:tRNA(adenine34) deaminase
MGEALQAARDALAAGALPIGAVLARGDGTIVAQGRDETNTGRGLTAHAEMSAFARAAGRMPTAARDTILISTLEPCVMCTGAAMIAGVETIVYGFRAPADSGTGRVRPPQTPASQMPRIVGGVCAAESRALLEAWLRTSGDAEQRPYVEQLLATT